MKRKKTENVIMLMMSMMLIGSMAAAQENEAAASPAAGADEVAAEKVVEPAESAEPEQERETEFLELEIEEEEEIPGAEAKPAEAGENLISIMLDEVPLEDAVRMFTRISGANILATATNLEGKTVTANLTDVEWKPALSSILEMHGLALVEKPPGSGVYSILVRAPDAPEPLIVETLFLKYATVSDVSPVIKSMLAADAGACLSEFPSRNALVIRSTSSNLGEIKQLIEKIDILSKQVCIETKFMELTDEASRQLGIKWDALEEFGARLSLGPYTTSETIDRIKTKQDKLSQWDKRQNVDGIDKRYDIHDQQYEESTTTYEESPPDSGNWIATTVITPTRTITDTIDKGKDVTSDIVDSFSKTITESQAAILEIDTLSIILSALKKTDGVTVISNPKIIVTSGNTNALFSVGQREPIIKKTIKRGTADSPGDEITAELDTGISTDFIKQGYLETGIILHVIPVVKTDNLIEAEISPSLRRKVGTKEVEGNSWPIISVKEIKTTFTLQSGQTVAIGGLTDTTDEKRVSKIPLLGDIPLIGKYLFSHTKEVESQVETIIFVTLSLAEPTALRREEGIPEDSELVHKKMLERSARRQKFQADLEKLKKDAGVDTEEEEKDNKVKSRLLKRRK